MGSYLHKFEVKFIDDEHCNDDCQFHDSYVSGFSGAIYRAWCKAFDEGLKGLDSRPFDCIRCEECKIAQALAEEEDEDTKDQTRKMS